MRAYARTYVLFRCRTLTAQLSRKARFDLGAEAPWRVVSKLDPEMVELATRGADDQSDLGNTFVFVGANAKVARERPSLCQLVLGIALDPAFFQMLALKPLHKSVSRVGLSFGIAHHFYLVALEPATRTQACRKGGHGIGCNDRMSSYASTQWGRHYPNGLVRIGVKIEPLPPPKKWIMGNRCEEGEDAVGAAAAGLVAVHAAE